MNKQRTGWLALGGVMAACFLAGWLASSNSTVAFGQPAPADAKEPKWLHGMNLKARNSTQTEFKDARKFGIEVFRDENNGNLIYISETGSIAVIPEKK